MGKDIMSLMSVPVFIMVRTAAPRLPRAERRLAGAHVRAATHGGDHGVPLAAGPGGCVRGATRSSSRRAASPPHAAVQDPELRLVYVVCFAVGAYPSAERTFKPFNPILGETFELALGDMRYVAEQVSHHPPVGAAHGCGPGWSYEITSAPRTKFLGNSIDVFPVGRTRITIRGETYALHPPQSRVHNILVGRTWVDHFGELTVEALSSGLVADCVFSEAGWFGAGRGGVSGTLFGADDTPRIALEGSWNKGLSYARCGPDGGVGPSVEWTEAWAATPPLAGDAYGFTRFAHDLNGPTTAPPGMLPSDARLRPDRRALAAGEMARAGAAKHALEERQRAERRRRDAAGEAWAPRWFRVAAGADNLEEVDTDVYEYTGAYDQQRAAAASQRAGEGEREHDEPEFSPWQFADSGKAA